MYRWLRIFGKEWFYLIFKPKIPRFLHNNVPYYSQWESKELVSDFLSGNLKAEDDPKWNKSGAKNKLEYTNWSWNACGMACFQMIYAHMVGKKIPLVELCRLSLNFGCYKVVKRYFNKGNYAESLPGMFYKPFIEFLRKEFNIKAVVSTALVIGEITKAIGQGNFVIASVNASIRSSDKNTKKIFRGGHLVLVFGYDSFKKELIIHNPSGLPHKSQEYVRIKIEDFKKYFSYRGIIINSKSNETQG